MPESLALIPFAALIGVVLGALGSGGAVLALPVLVYVARLEVRTAVGVSQVVVGTAALFGALLHFRSGKISGRHAWIYALAGIPAAKLGGWAGQQIEARWQMLLFGCLVVGAGWRMWRGPETRSRGEERIGWEIVAGGCVGFLTGLLGVGGGFLLVPVLVAFSGLELRRATATSLVVIAANCAVGAAENFALWSKELALVGMFLSATMVGTVGGLALARRMSEQRLRMVLAGVLMGVGLLVVGWNSWRG